MLGARDNFCDQRDNVARPTYVSNCSNVVAKKVVDNLLQINTVLWIPLICYMISPYSLHALTHITLPQTPKFFHLSLSPLSQLSPLSPFSSLSPLSLISPLSPFTPSHHSLHSLHSLHYLHSIHSFQSIHSLNSLHSLYYFHSIHSLHSLHSLHYFHSIRSLHSLHTLHSIHYFHSIHKKHLRWNWSNIAHRILWKMGHILKIFHRLFVMFI